MTILELIENRNKAWEAAKAFVDTKRDKDGILSEEDAKTYAEMEQKVKNLSAEIERMQAMDAMEQELAKPTSTPITGKPMKASGAEDEQTGVKSKAYKKSFWNAMRQKAPMPDVLNALQEGTDSEGGYLVPDEFEHTLVESLEEENIFRKLAHIINTSSGDRKIPVVASKGSASWVDEEGSITESDDSFGQVSIGAYKLGTLIKVSNELLHDSVFNLEQYISKEFARRIGTKEEDAFFNGDGDGKPTGIFHSTGGAQVGVTAASTSAITADEIIDLFYSLGAPYRKRAVWVLNDATVKAVRKLKDGNGNYLWQPALTSGTPDMLLGRPVYTSTAVPSISAGAKVIAFGDFGYYWIADRQGRVFKKLSELYATTDQTGFVATQRVDGKLILAEAIKVLQMKAS
jgi:HK97 family phage major capsid protein